MLANASAEKHRAEGEVATKRAKSQRIHSDLAQKASEKERAEEELATELGKTLCAKDKPDFIRLLRFQAD